MTVLLSLMLSCSSPSSNELLILSQSQLYQFQNYLMVDAEGSKEQDNRKAKYFSSQCNVKILEKLHGTKCFAILG